MSVRTRLARLAHRAARHRRFLTLVVLLTCVAGAATGGERWLRARLGTPLGLRASVSRGVGDERTPLLSQVTERIDLDFLETRPDLPRRRFSVRWEGVWWLDEATQVDLYLGADDRATLWIDGQLILRRSVAEGQRTASRRVSLARGFHDILLDYRQLGGGYSLTARWAPANQDPRPLATAALFPSRPSARQLRATERLRQLDLAASVLWLAPLTLLVSRAGLTVGRRLKARLSPVELWWLAALASLSVVVATLGRPFYTQHLPPNVLAVGLAGLYFLLPDSARQTRRRRAAYWVASVLIVILVDLLAVPQAGMTDFMKAQYRAGVSMVSNPAFAYDEVCGRYAYLPVSGLLFVPYGLFERATANLLYTVTGRLAVLAAAFLFVRVFALRGWRMGVLLALLAFNGPLDRILWLGNVTHFVLVLLLVALLVLDGRRPARAGILLGLAPLLKPSMGLLGFYFVVRERWPVVVAWATTGGAVLALSLVIFGLDLHETWWRTCMQQFQGGTIPAFRQQSIDGLLARHWLVDANVNDWAAVPVDPTFRILHWIGVVAILAPALVAARSASARPDPGNTYLELFIFQCAAILISPVSWSHYYLFLLLPIALCLSDRFPEPARPTWLRRLGLAVFVTAVVLVTLPETLSVTLFRSHDGAGITRLLLSHYLFGGLLFYVFLLARRFTGAGRA